MHPFTKHNRRINEIGKPVALTLYSLAKRSASNLHSALQNNFTCNNNNNNSNISMYIRNNSNATTSAAVDSVCTLPTQTSMLSTQAMSHTTPTQRQQQQQQQLQRQQ